MHDIENMHNSHGACSLVVERPAHNRTVMRSNRIRPIHFSGVIRWGKHLFCTYRSPGKTDTKIRFGMIHSGKKTHNNCKIKTAPAKDRNNF